MPLLSATRNVVLLALAGLTLLVSPLHQLQAQPTSPGLLQLSVRAGFVGADDAYQSNCGHSSIALGAEVQGGGRVFPLVSLDHLVGSGGGDVGCFPALLPSIGNAVGGLRLEGATRLGLGVGARAGAGPLQFEGALTSGLITGRPGFEGNDGERGRRVLPQVGGNVSVVVLRLLVLSVSSNLTLLPLETTPVGGGAPTTTRAWSRMTTVQAGVRVGVGR